MFKEFVIPSLLFLHKKWLWGKKGLVSLKAAVFVITSRIRIRAFFTGIRDFMMIKGSGNLRNHLVQFSCFIDGETEAQGVLLWWWFGFAFFKVTRTKIKTQAQFLFKVLSILPCCTKHDENPPKKLSTRFKEIRYVRNSNSCLIKQTNYTSH